MLIRHALISVVALLSAVNAASAEQYSVSYEASGVYPEDAGWTRYTTGGGALRYFEDGALVIDSRASTQITDAYLLSRPGALDPGPGEVFVMQWKLRVDQLQGPFDSSVNVFSDGRRGAFLDFGYGAVWDDAIGHLAATFDPALFHDFEFRSADMLTYDLYIDGTVAYRGGFTAPLLDSSLCAWGDCTQGGASLSRWEYFRIGVVPESSSVSLLLVAGLAVLERARARHHRSG